MAEPVRVHSGVGGNDRLAGRLRTGQFGHVGPRGLGVLAVDRNRNLPAAKGEEGRGNRRIERVPFAAGRVPDLGRSGQHRGAYVYP